MSTELNRRHALGAAAAVGVGVPLLAACAGPTSPRLTGPDPTPKPGETIGEASKVPVGGCAVFEGPRVVVTQPVEGEFKAFSAICTHRGCAVSSSSEGDIPCHCHGSRFSLSDGSVETGPARDSLPEVEIVVEKGTIRFPL